ncbi:MULTISPECIES: metallophosphoesterase [unclassified Fusibacter]|uniref:metallophosphoesterase n=1 Tax=unclassified Fusibacter TaxID=2624464 RepID=UPI0010108D5D|nr:MULTISPECIES: metallophosphoesterase [unclassified Fusibacter]MCK8061450.1 DNA-directed RNA polymerase I subunit RPA49 family protein [Fusibacter sp. A2]NPE23637.1 hypothetical protein [Fusibacter sp. A1]RXV58910.1 hypothetical protein DWB64_17765 [Fusibacter sp. A1]
MTNRFLHRLHYPYAIPSELFDQGIRLLHISDTPTMTYASLKHIIALINPTYIVHTGDLVDNIKLELHPSKLIHYQRKVKALASILNSCEAKLFITKGNHDDFDTLGKLFGSDQLFKDMCYPTIEGVKLGISHYRHKIDATKADLLLFGHDLKVKSQFDHHPYLSNAIEGIFVFEFHPLKVYRLSYPFGTDDVRMKKFKAGI